jgi:hypothetical protein
MSDDVLDRARKLVTKLQQAATYAASLSAAERTIANEMHAHDPDGPTSSDVYAGEARIAAEDAATVRALITEIERLRGQA